MPRIEFHFNAPALVPYTCRLLRKVQQHGLRAQVVGEPQTLALLDPALWTFSALDFIAHATAQDAPALRDRAQVLLVQAPVADWPAAVLVNLAEAVPPGFEGFERVIEVVTQDEWHRAQARQRWRHYTELGHALQRHDLAAASA